MAARMGIRELRDTLPATLRRVRAGETIEITHHDTPIAQLTPIPMDRIARLEAQPDIRPGRPFEPRPTYPSRTGILPSEALEEDRSAR